MKKILINVIKYIKILLYFSLFLNNFLILGTLSKPSSTLGMILNAISPYTTQTRTETSGSRRKSRFAKTKETVKKLHIFVYFIGISLLFGLIFILYSNRFKLWKSYDKAIGRNVDKN